jgi:hypothetical protein
VGALPAGSGAVLPVTRVSRWQRGRRRWS